MWIDVTRPIRTGQLSYPGDPPITVEVIAGEDAFVRRLCLTTHSGTHVDVPAHLVPGGHTVDDLGWERFRLTAQVVHVESPRLASVREVAPKLRAGVEAVLFRTRNEELPRDAFCPEHVYVEPRLATLLVQRGARLVGIDYLSVDPPGTLDVHRALLREGVLIMEDIDLRSVGEGVYRLVWLPLKVQGGDGAPCRALLETVGDER